jgi:hypothetical protein
MTFFTENLLKLLTFFKSAALLSDNRMTIVILRRKPAAPVSTERLNPAGYQRPVAASLSVFTARRNHHPQPPPEEAR